MRWRILYIRGKLYEAWIWAKVICGFPQKNHLDPHTFCREREAITLEGFSSTGKSKRFCHHSKLRLRRPYGGLNIASAGYAVG